MLISTAAVLVYVPTCLDAMGSDERSKPQGQKRTLLKMSSKGGKCTGIRRLIDQEEEEHSR